MNTMKVVFMDEIYEIRSQLENFKKPFREDGGNFIRYKFIR